MSLRISYSGPSDKTNASEQFEVKGTPAAMAGLGRLMQQLDSNTMVKGHTGPAPSYPLNLPGLKLILTSGDTDALRFREDNNALRVEAGMKTFKLLGQSLINSFNVDDQSGHNIAVSQALPSNALHSTANKLFFTGEPEQHDEVETGASGWFDQP